ncbi:MAG: 16S rRNA (cytidine(1402)-2'-O)-methyltransferase [Clostridia bacterium]|nr:16S rRNA (cytidine(1402)-2'-O)-methyltransferase [Clostridia bacterium]
MLYLTATPIGNLKDISQRAIEVLNAVDVIACEDTRHSLKLLTAYGIKKPLVAYHKFNERAEGEKLVALLKEGKDVALITDAGTPVISDPGNVLVRLLIENGLEYTVIPGANAFVPALVLSGFDASRFSFIGFLPERAKERDKLLSKYKNLDMTLIFYCAPHDVVKTVERLYSSLGERKACAVREITKLHESVEFFNLSEGYPGEPRGEYVILVDGAEEEEQTSDMTAEEHLMMYLEKGMDKKEAVKLVAKERGVPKNEIYKITIKEDK